MPITQPPGKVTSVLPNLASKGPITKTDARIACIKCGLTVYLVIPVVSISKILFLISNFIMPPSSSISWHIKPISSEFGTLVNLDFPSVKIKLAIITKTAFFAPASLTEPFNPNDCSTEI